MIKSVTKNPEAFTLKPSRDMEELPLDCTKVRLLLINHHFLVKNCKALNQRCS